MKEQSSEPSPGAPVGGFARNVLTLASGTAVAQLLLALAVPVLARLYTPAEYGVLAVYSSTLTVLVVAASLRYETAIPLPREEFAAASLLALTLGILLATGAVVSLLVWLGGVAFVSAVNVPTNVAYVVSLVPWDGLALVAVIVVSSDPTLSWAFASPSPSAERLSRA